MFTNESSTTGGITLFVELIKARCIFLEAQGYLFHHMPNCVWYEKSDPTGGYTISFNYLDYDTIDVYGLSACRRLNEVESVFQKSIPGWPEDLPTIHTYFDGDSFREHIHPELLPTSDNYHFQISDVASLASYAELIIAFYERQVLPFFETYATVKAIHEWVASKPVEQHKELLSSQENVMVLRRIIIMYLAGDQGYETLLNEYKTYLAAKEEQVFRHIYEHLLKVEHQLAR